MIASRDRIRAKCAVLFVLVGRKRCGKGEGFGTETVALVLHAAEVYPGCGLGCGLRAASC